MTYEEFKRRTQQQNNYYEQKRLFDSLSLGTFGDDVRRAYESLNKYLTGGWQDPSAGAREKQSINALLSRITGTKNYMNSYAAGYDQDELQKRLSELDELQKSLTEGLSYLDQQEKIYAGFRNADEYNAALNAHKNREELERFGSAYADYDSAGLMKAASDLRLMKTSYDLGQQGAAPIIMPNGQRSDEYIDSVFKQYGANADNALEYADKFEQLANLRYADMFKTMDSAALDSYSSGLTSAMEAYSKAESDFARFRSPENKAALDDAERVLRQNFGVTPGTAATKLGEAKGIINEIKVSNLEKWVSQQADFSENTTYNDNIANNFGKYVNLTPSLYKQIEFAPAGQAAAMQVKADLYALATQEERDTYNYLLNTVGADAADQYAINLEEKLEKKYKTTKTTKWEELSKVHPWLASAASIANNVVFGTAAGVVGIGEYLLTGNADEDSALNTLHSTVDTVRSAVPQAWAEKYGWDDTEKGVVSFFYGAGMSVADSIANNLLFGGYAGGAGSVISLASRGLTASAGTVRAAKERGATDAQAFGLGIVAGVAEALFEKLPLDNLIKIKDAKHLVKPTLKQAFTESLKSTGKQILTEGFEEMGTEAVNILADALIMADKSELATKYEQYRSEGLSGGTASLRTLLDVSGQVLLSGLGGAISGAAMGSAFSAPYVLSSAASDVSGKIKDSAIGSQLIRLNVAPQIVEAGLSFGEGSEAYELASKLQKRANHRAFMAQKNASTGESAATANLQALGNYRGPLDADDLGRLFRTVTTEGKKQLLDHYTTVYEQKLSSDGSKGNRGLARAVALTVAGENTTEAQKRLIAASGAAKQLINESKALLDLKTEFNPLAKTTRYQTDEGILNIERTGGSNRYTVSFIANGGTELKKLEARTVSQVESIVERARGGASFGEAISRGYEGEGENVDFSGSKAYESAKAAGASEHVASSVGAYASAFPGLRISFGDTGEGRRGVFRTEYDGTRSVVINPNSVYDTDSVITHEIFHDLEKTEAGQKFIELATEYAKAQPAKSKASGAANRYDEIVDLYKKDGRTRAEDIPGEVGAKVAGEVIAKEGSLDAVLSKMGKNEASEFTKKLKRAASIVKTKLSKVDKTEVKGAKLAEHRAEMMLDLYTRAAKQRQLEGVLADSAMSGYIDESTADFGANAKNVTRINAKNMHVNENFSQTSEEKTQTTQISAKTSEIENKKASQNERGEIIGLTKDGRRVYKSGFDSSVNMDKRIELFKERIATIFNLGAVELKTDIKKLQIKGDKFTSKKNLFGDKKGDPGEYEAKINALYDLADILATSKYLPDETQPEESYKNPSEKPKNAAHKDVKYWYKFENNIVFDDVPYTVTFNIRDKGKDQYQYLIDFKEDKTPGVNNTATKSLLQAYQASYDNSISQKSDLSTENEKNIEKSDLDERYDERGVMERQPVAQYKPYSAARMREVLTAATKLMTADELNRGWKPGDPYFTNIKTDRASVSSMAKQLSDMFNFAQGKNATEEDIKTVAKSAADYLIANTYADDAEFAASLTTEQDLATRALAVLSKGLRRTVLGEAEIGDIRARFGKKKARSVISRWRVTEKAKGTISPSELAAELSSVGVTLDVDGNNWNEADIAIALNGLYERSREVMGEKIRSQIGGAEEYSALRDKIAEQIYDSYRDGLSEVRVAQATAAAKVIVDANRARELGRRKRETGALSKAEWTDLTRAIGAIAKGYSISVPAVRDFAKKYRAFIEKQAGILNELITAEDDAEIEKASKRYEDAKNEGDDQLLDIINPRIAAGIYAIAEGDDSTSLTADELEALHAGIRNLLALDRRYDRVFKDGRWQDTDKFSKQALSESDSYWKNKEAKGEDKEGTVKDWFFEDTQDPEHVAARVGGYNKKSVLASAVREIKLASQEAQYKEAQYMRRVEEFFESHDEFRKRYEKERIEFKYVRENPLTHKKVEGSIKLTLGEFLSLYMTSKRKHAFITLAMSDIVFKAAPGVRDAEVTLRGNKPDLAGLDETQIEAITRGMGNGLISQINAVFKEKATADDKAFVSLVEDFYANESKNDKSATDMMLFGYTNVVDGYYYPIARDKNAFDVNLIGNDRILDSIVGVNSFSFNQKTVERANRTMVVGDALSVMQNHAHQLAVYSTMTVPLQNVNRIYNQKITFGGEQTSLHAYINKHISKRFGEYFHNYLLDVQGSPRVRGNKFVNRAFGKIKSNYAKAVLSLNAKSVMTQFSTVFAMTGQVSFGSWAKGVAIGSTISRVDGLRRFEEMDRYSHGAAIRNDSNEQYLATGVSGKLSQATDKLMFAQVMTDRLTCYSMWNMCQYEIAKKNGLALGTEENKIEAGKLLDEKILELQDTSSAATKTGIARDPDEIVKSFAMFRSSELKQWSRLCYMAGEMRAHGVKGRRSAFAKEVSAFLASKFYVVALALLWNALRDKWPKGKDDEPREVWKEFLDTAALDMLGVIPFLGDLAEGIFGFANFESPVESVLNDATSSVKSFWTLANDFVSDLSDGKWDRSGAQAEKLISVVSNFAQLLGIPARNVTNLLNIVKNGVMGAVNTSDRYGISDIFGEKNYVEDLKAAIADGDTKLAETIIDLMLYDRTGDHAGGEAASELADLYRAGYEGLLPSKTPSKVTITKTDKDGNEEKTEIELDEKQRKEYEKEYSKSTGIIKRLVASDAYGALTSDVRATAISDVYDLCRERAKTKVLGADMSTAVAATYFISDTVYIAARAHIKAIKADKSIKNKRTAVERYLRTLGLTKVEQRILLYVSGYRSETEKNAVYRALRTLDVPAEEKAIVAETLGFAVKGNRIIYG